MWGVGGDEVSCAIIIINMVVGVGKASTYFSLAMRSLLSRSRASLSLFKTYWVTT